MAVEVVYEIRCAACSQPALILVFCNGSSDSFCSGLRLRAETS